MPTQADRRRILKLRAIMFRGGAEGWTTEELDAALRKLYARSRAAPKKK